MPLAILVEFAPQPNCRDDFLAQLRHDAAATLRDDGCLRMEVLTACDGSGRIMLNELWRDQAAIEAHRTKPGHSHAWQEPLILSKRISRWETD